MVNDKSSEKAPATTRIRMRIMVGTIIFGVALAVGLFALGCGKSNRQAAVAPSDQVYTVSQPGGGLTPTRTAALTPRGDEPPAVPVDSLPPDVDVSVADTLVMAGVPIELKAEGSADVVGMSLSDGIHQPQLFEQDHNTGSWRTLYRVPLKPRTDRIGLSVTARNGAGRWRRVWVFLSLQGEQPSVSADTTVGK